MPAFVYFEGSVVDWGLSGGLESQGPASRKGMGNMAPCPLRYAPVEL